MRIAIVNDMKLARELLRRTIQAMPGHEVAWTAFDGAQAVAMARQDCPDLILMDLLMPQLNGVEATRQIMAETPCPILIVTASVDRNIALVYEAMGLGAVDAVKTPVLGAEGQLQGTSAVQEKIERIAKLLVGSPETRPCDRSPSPSPSEGAPGEEAVRGPAHPLVLIGASTGGPKVLAQVLSGLPSDLAASVIVVQHVDAAFAPGLSQWLGEHSRLPVSLIRPRHVPRPGQVLVAHTTDHLVLTADRRLRYVAEPREQCYRPSVDVFFHSAARFWPEPGVAVILTGMGRDGAEGLLALRRAGWYTIAQDRSHCTVWGMPKAAVECGAACDVLPPSRIAEAVVAHLRRRP